MSDYLDDWTPARAARAQEATERYLLGSCRPARVETAAERVRRRLAEEAQSIRIVKHERTDR